MGVGRRGDSAAAVAHEAGKLPDKFGVARGARSGVVLQADADVPAALQGGARESAADDVSAEDATSQGRPLSSSIAR